MKTENAKENNLKKALAECADKELQSLMLEREHSNSIFELRKHPAQFRSSVTMDVVEFLSEYINWVYVSRYVTMSKDFINAHIEDLNIYAMMVYNPHIDKVWVKEVLDGEDSEIRDTAISNIYSLYHNGVIDYNTVIRYGSETDIDSALNLKKRASKIDFGLFLK